MAVGRRANHFGERLVLSSSCPKNIAAVLMSLHPGNADRTDPSVRSVRLSWLTPPAASMAGKGMVGAGSSGG
jgi:hypothetical protein